MENKDVFELIIDNAIEIVLAFDNDNCICKINEMAKKELQLDDNAIGTSIVFISKTEIYQSSFLMVWQEK